jgi:hypothetical protein
MTSVGAHEAIGRIVDGVRADLPGLVDRAVGRIRAEVLVYARAEVVPVEALEFSVGRNLDFILAGLTGATPTALQVAEETGRTRAVQGAPLADILSAYRLGFVELWAAVVETARGMPGVPDEVLTDLAGSVFELHNTYCDVVIGAYRDEAQQLVRAQERERAVLVEAVLTGSAAHGTLWEVAQALRLPVEGAFVVVAARADLGRDPMPRIESALAARDVGSVWRLENDMSLGVLSLGEAARNAAALEVLGRHAEGPVGVSPVFASLRQAAWAARLARLAAANLTAPGVEQFRDRPLDVLLAAAPQAALEASRAVLGGIGSLPEEDRQLLLATFDAWVEAKGSANDAAAVLFCHPNTVRYRLRRIEAETGRDLSAPADIAELVAAARAWSRLPHGT